MTVLYTCWICLREWEIESPVEGRGHKLCSENCEIAYAWRFSFTHLHGHLTLEQFTRMVQEGEIVI